MQTKQWQHVGLGLRGRVAAGRLSAAALAEQRRRRGQALLGCTHCCIDAARCCWASHAPERGLVAWRSSRSVATMPAGRGSECSRQLARAHSPDTCLWACWGSVHICARPQRCLRAAG